jgi:thiamine biosynthesis protein ThiS
VNTLEQITIRVNGTPRQVAPGSRLSDLLRTLDLNPRFLAVERNLAVVPRTQHAACELCDGDELEIVTLVGGG